MISFRKLAAPPLHLVRKGSICIRELEKRQECRPKDIGEAENKIKSAKTFTDTERTKIKTSLIPWKKQIFCPL